MALLDDVVRQSQNIGLHLERSNVQSRFSSHTETRIQILSEGHRKFLHPNINARSTTVQKYCHENSMSHTWLPETMMTEEWRTFCPYTQFLFDSKSVCRVATDLGHS